MADTQPGLIQQMLTELPPAFWIGGLALIGAMMGSFLNVVIYRLPRNCLSINKPSRSFCPACKTQLKARDNVPIFGWFLLGGKCRYCGAKFSIRYALVELLVALLFGFAAWKVLYAEGIQTTHLAAWITLAHVLLMITVLVPWALIDLDLHYIPDGLTFLPLALFVPLSANASTYQWGVAGFNPLMFGLQAQWLDSMLSAFTTGIAAMAFLWLMGRMGNLLFRKQAQKVGGDSMGWADVKIMLMLGVMLGWPKMIAAFFVAIALGALVGTIARVLRGTLGVPFGPFLAIGALAVMLFAPNFEAALNWYFNLLQGVAK
ncbi:MAG: prepilin peptidase [Planctomycetes bacterium]|nr:prepilin peptidase [Planctomycetota bacterium]